MDDTELKDALMHLAEECAELAKVCSKIYRFGPDARKKEGAPTNLDRLYEEFEDVQREFYKVVKIA